MATRPDFVEDLNPERDLVVVIMAGGAGTRFWPASTEDKPKQFLRFFGDRTLLQQTLDRVSSLVPSERVLVLTGARFVDLCREQLPELPPENIVGEPMRRDTAAAVALAAVLVERRFGDAVMAVLTSDQLIEPTAAFQETLLSAARGAKKGDALYTFGIKPTHPATGYGYLELGEALGVDDGVSHYPLTRFVEKPDEKTAQSYLEKGTFVWNSGMFVWRTTTLIAEFERQLPDHLRHLRASVADDGSVSDESLARGFEPLARVSVDYGIMEHARNVRAVSSTFSWSDVGSFASLAEHLPADADGNAHRGALFAIESQGNVVFCDDSDETVALIGVSDLVVVRAGKRTLVVPKARCEDIKKLVNILPESER